MEYDITFSLMLGTFFFATAIISLISAKANKEYE